MLNDNFEQQFQSCVLNAQNNYKSAQNQINSLNASRKMKLREFSVIFGFSNMLCGKKQKPGNAGNQQKAL